MAEPSLGELSVEAARALMVEGVKAGPSETIALRDALGRTLAEPVEAIRDQPPFDASAMDGYAIPVLEPDPSHPEAAQGRAYRMIGESAAGRPFLGRVEAGEAVRIFTGSPVPEGCRVLVQERALRDADRVRFQPEAGGLEWVRPRGCDFRAGQRLLEAGVRLDPWRIALAAAAGRHEVKVAPRPRVAVLSTGAEIMPAGSPVEIHQIYDSGGPALLALIRLWGGSPQALLPVADDEAAIAAAAEATACDLIVTVGGASVGDHDLTKPALRRLGLELRVDTVRLRPGKPTWFGRLSDGRRVLGLPGNPASALVCAELFLRPLLQAWQGRVPGLALEYAKIARALPPTGPREHWMRTALESRSDGALWAAPFSDQDSSLVRVFAGAEALLRRPAGAPAAQEGDLASILRLGRL
jgi:molybdopterin molybdotransferase